MNNVIEKIKAQATEDILGVPVLNAELFAKLIVKDCTNLLKEMSELPDDLGGNAYLRCSLEKIKEHFGAE